MLGEYFFRQFPDEETCKAHFKKQREARGIVCKNGNAMNVNHEQILLPVL